MTSVTMEQKSSTPSISNSKVNRKAIMAANKSKAIEKLDKMVEEVMETDLPQFCPFSLPPLPNSLSDSGICSHGRHTHGHSAHACHQESKIPTSQSFRHSRDQQCCSGFGQHANGRHNRIHSNACQIL